MQKTDFPVYTRVVNVRSYLGDEPITMIDRSTRYGNPYVIGGDGTREQVISKYRKWLRAKLLMEPDFLEPLRGKLLGCWCVPADCHGNVIVEMLEGKDV